MNDQFLDDHLLYEFVSATHAALGVEEESNIGMSWADFDSSGELENAYPNMSPEDEKEFEEQLRKAAVASQSSFEELEELEPIGDSKEAEEEFMSCREERQEEIIEKSKRFLNRFIK